MGIIIITIGLSILLSLIISLALISWAFRFIKIDALELLQKEDCPEAITKLVEMKYRQKVGLALWRIARDIPLLHPNNKESPARIKRIAGKILSDGPLKGSADFDLVVLVPTNLDENKKETIKNIREAAWELSLLKLASYLLRINDRIDYTIKIVEILK